MKFLTKLAIASAVPALAFAAPASAQVSGDVESYAINLGGSVPSECVLTPNGSTTFNVDMLDTGNQGLLAIGYSCNSPYTVSLQSTNGGMENTTSGGAVNIPYTVSGGATGVGLFSVDSDNMQTTAYELVSDTDWVNILANLGAAGGTLELDFAGLLSQYAVAGEYEDTLTIVLEADL